MTIDDFDAFMKPLLTPIDFADLVARGILKKAGRGQRSYLLLKPNELPEHASMQVSSLSQTKEGLQLTFTDRTKAAQKAVDRFHGKTKQAKA